MILDGNKGWLWTLTELPEIAKGKLVKFNVLEREFGTRFQSSSFVGVDESTIAYDVSDSDTLLGILFDESIKSKCIAAIDVQHTARYFASDVVMGLDITVVLVQGGKGYTNIDAEVLDAFAKVLET